MSDSWIAAEIRAIVTQHYGMPMIVNVVSRDEHCANHLSMISYVNYYDQLLSEWSSETGPCIDIVVWDHTTESLQMVQMLCFRDAYLSHAAWVYAVRSLIRENPSVWIVKHLE